MSKRFIILLIYFFIPVVSYAMVTVNIEPNNEGVIDKARKVNIVVRLTSDVVIDMSQIVIRWNDQDITEDFLASSASQFNDSKTELTFYYPISASDLQAGHYVIAATSGDGKWFSSTLIMQDIDEKSLHFSYSTFQPALVVEKENILLSSSSASSSKAGKACTAIECTTNVPTLNSNRECGRGTAESGNNFPCCDNNGDRKNTPGVDGNCTWYAWNRAQQAWGKNMPTLRGPGGTWHNNTVFTRKPKLDQNGKAIPGIAENTRMHHVAWIESGDANSITVSEQNCYAKKIGKTDKNGKCTADLHWESCIPGGGDVRTPSYSLDPKRDKNASYWYFIYAK